MKRYLFELAAWLPPRGVERRSVWVSDEWLSAELTREPCLDRVVEFEPGNHPISDLPVVHRIAVEGYVKA